MAIEDKQIIVDDLLIHYLESKSGNGSAPSILVLHGWRHYAGIWKEIIDQLGENTNVYALDFPGFGRSQLPPANFGLKEYTNVVFDFIQKLGLKNTTVIGHSFGGKVAIALAVQYPEVVRKLILVDSAGVPHNNSRTSGAQIIAKVVKPAFQLPVLRKLRPSIYKMIGAEDYVATPQLRPVFVNIVKQNVVNLLPKVSQPTLLIWGKNDTATPVGDAKLMEQKIPNAKLVILDNAGHNSFMDQPEAVLANIRQFRDAS